MKKKIMYVDFGTHEQANEIDMFFVAIAKLCVDVETIIYAVEAHPNYAQSVSEKYKDFDNIIVLPVAVSNKPGETNLYISKISNGHGNSIFATKNNVDPTHKISVDGVDGGSLMHKLIDYHKADVVIMKYNIEGAEYYLFNSIIKKNLQEKIDIFCGAKSDMHKVAALCLIEDNFLEYIKTKGINRQDFYFSMIPEETHAMINLMSQKITEKLK